jgi:hypothetical protein
MTSATLAQSIARLASLARGAARSLTSQNVTTGHPGSGQRQIRLHQATTTGIPNVGASARRCTRRPCLTATTSQAGQPVRTWSVSTVTIVRARSWSTSSICKWGTVNIAPARAHQPTPDPHLQSDTSESP